MVQEPQADAARTEEKRRHGIYRGTALASGISPAGATVSRHPAWNRQCRPSGVRLLVAHLGVAGDLNVWKLAPRRGGKLGSQAGVDSPRSFPPPPWWRWNDLGIPNYTWHIHFVYVASCAPLDTRPVLDTFVNLFFHFPMASHHSKCTQLWF